MTFDEHVLARTIYGEARGEPRAGQIAVAWAVRNRLSGGRWSRSIAGVCLQPMQFSCWNNNDPNRAKLLAASEDDLRGFTEVASDVLSGKEPDPTSGSTHYQVVGTGASWAKGLTPAAVIGRHEFFNNVP